jgi:DNA-binding transcriptional LysR family regulator
VEYIHGKIGMKQHKATAPLEHRGLKLTHLRLMAALAETGQISAAAAAIGISQPAASRMLAEIERILGKTVHFRTGRGMALTAVGQAFALRSQRIQLELRDAARDMAEAAAGGVGHVRIGSVTGPAIDRVLPVLRNARLTAPQVTFEVIVGPSDVLCQNLLSGKIDFAIGRLPEGPTRDLLTMSLIAPEPVALVARRGHPLTLRPNPTVAELLHYDWVMPPPDSLLTQTVLRRLKAHGAEAPQQRLSTASFLLIFALLQQSNAIAPLALTVANSFSKRPDSPYVQLEVNLGIEVEPFGLVTRAGSILPPTAERIAREIQNLSLPALG